MPHEADNPASVPLALVTETYGPLTTTHLRPLIRAGATEIIMNALDFCDVRLFGRDEIVAVSDHHWLLDGCSLRIERYAPVRTIRGWASSGALVTELRMLTAPFTNPTEVADTDALQELDHALAALSDRWGQGKHNHATEAYEVRHRLQARSDLAASAFIRAYKHLGYALDSGHPEFLDLLGELARFELRVLSAAPWPKT